MIKDKEVYDYLREIHNYKILSKEEQRELMIETKKGNKDALLKLYHSNLKLVVEAIKPLFNYDVLLSKMDLIQEGNILLLNAIEKYDMNYIDTVKFSSYAFKFIQRSINKKIMNLGYMIRIPTGKYQELKLYERKYNELYAKLNREPSHEELSLELNISLEKINELLKCRNLLQVESFNYIIGEKDNELLNTVDGNEEDILDILVREKESEELKKMISTHLTKLQRKVICLRYGINDGIPKGLQEVANILGYPDRRYIYEIEKRGLCNLRKAITMDEKKVKL